MRFAIYFISFFFAFFIAHKAYAFSCTPELQDTYSILDILFQNDVIFVGEWTDGEEEFRSKSFTYTASVIEALKGLPHDVDTLKIKSDRMLDDMIPFSVLQGQPPSLIFAHFGTNSELFITHYRCKKIPRDEAIISFLKGPYRYRYLIVMLAGFLIFSIWRVGGVEKLLTTDLKSLSGAIFLNKPIEIKNNQTYYGRVLRRLCIPILIVAIFFLSIFVDGYLRFYNFF